MIIHRWQAPILPTEEQALSLLKFEGFDASIEILSGQKHIKDHRHALSEILFITHGELIVNISGNQVLLRMGDRIEIPANTKHSYDSPYGECRVIFGYKV